MSYTNENSPEKEIEKLSGEIHNEEGKIAKLQDEVIEEKKKLEELSKELVEVEDRQKDTVLAAVMTTSGTWPKHGFEKVHSHQEVKGILKKAAAELKIVDTNGWIATVSGREIDPDKNYIENNLRGEIEIDYKPKHGGGGYE